VTYLGHMYDGEVAAHG